MSDDQSPSSGRRKREKSTKSGRFAALEKLKQLKGSKHKYQVSDLDNVYEEVDEREYSKRVQERQYDDWIVDDDGSGYVEDGREIFDDDLDDESIILASRKKKRGGDRGSNKRAKLGNANEHEKSNNIRSMLANMPSKKEAPVSLAEDDILGGIMQEINGDSMPVSKDTNEVDTCMESSEESALKYLKNFAAVKPKAISQSLAKKCSAKRRIREEFNTSVDEANSSFQEDIPVPLPPQKEEFNTSVDEANSAFQDVPDTPQASEKELHGNEADVEDLCATMFHDDFPDMTEVKVENGESRSLQKSLEAEKKAAQTFSEEIPSKKSEETDNKHMNDVSIISSEPFTMEKLTVNVESLPFVQNAEGEKMLRFFWLDAHEEPFKQPGVVFLFGKVWIENAKEYVSCCLTVRNVERKILVLPRETLISNDTQRDVTFLDVYKEFSEITSKYGIMEFRSRKVEMNNCFNPEVPSTCEYMEVKYSAHCKMLPDDLQGKTFSNVFGTGTSALERFLIERRIKGPCWLDVHGAQTVNNCLSWCKVEMSVEKMEMVSIAMTAQKLPPPPVVLLALQIRTVVNPKSNSNEVALIVGLVNREFPLHHEPLANKQYSQHFSILAPLSDRPYPYDVRECMKQDGISVEKMDSERGLLNNLLTKVQRLDPDFIVGYDVLGFDLDIIFHRLLAHKVNNWSRLGRLRRHFPNPAEKKRMAFLKNYLSGRLPCDVMLAAKEHVQGVRSYDLETLCTSVLEKETHAALTFEEIRNHFESGNKLKMLIKQTLMDTAHALQIMCQISAIPLALQITNIAGNVMSRTLIGGRAERNEYLLLHAFHEKKFIPPEKMYKKSAKNAENEETEKQRGKIRKKPNYSGGLVLEPKKGLYDNMVLVMDFNSLYPSIIMEYNICFTTVEQRDSSDEDLLPDVPSKDIEMGILPAEIRKLVESRSSVRKLMQDSKLNEVERSQLNIRQIALKLMANSTYGCLGFSHARFYAKPLAALITAKGREILMKTKEYVESMSYEVIYGDTDSIMINTNCADFEEVTKIGKQILQAVNKLYRCINLDIDGVYKCMLLLKKKKYAVTEVTRLPDGSLKSKIKLKGLDIVRRDWSRISVESGHFVVEQLLSDLPLEDKLVLIENHLRKIAEDLRAGRVPLPLLTISKQLTRSIEHYADDKSQPHVLVAKRLLQKGMCRMKAGDTVSYIICDDGTNGTAVQRAYHLDEIKADKSLQVDYKYYLGHQIHPVITRLLDPVEGIDSCSVAEFLGLDPAPYRQALKKHAAASEEEPAKWTDIVLNLPEHYDNCERFSFTCVQCKTETVMDKPVKKDDAGNIYPALSRCSNSQCTVLPIQYLPSLQNKLTILLRSQFEQYAQSMLTCEDPACPQRSNFVPLEFNRSYPVCDMCESAVMYREFTSKSLYRQLYSFKLTFDIQSSEHKNEVQLSPDVEAAYSVLFKQVENFLKHSKYSKMELDSLFKYCSPADARSIQAAQMNGVIANRYSA